MTTQHNHRIGLGLLGSPELLKMVELAQLAETHGFESVWVAETRLTRDGITPCAAIAMATTRLKIATGIVNVYTRGAVLTAVSFVSLDEVSQGRIIMGLGTGSPLVLKPQGVAFHKPLTRLRETSVEVEHNQQARIIFGLLIAALVQRHAAALTDPALRMIADTYLPALPTLPGFL